MSRRSHIIGFQPLKTGTAEHESALERDFVTLTSFLYPRAVVTSQPVTIAFADGVLRRRYTPDFLVRDAQADLAELIEIKYEQNLRENWKNLKFSFEAAERWAQENRATFRIVTECDIRGPLLNNAKRLLSLRSAPLDTRTALLALTATHSLPFATLWVGACRTSRTIAGTRDALAAHCTRSGVRRSHRAHHLRF